MITVACPHCDSELKGPDTFRGKRVRCKKCGEPFTIPMEDDVIEEVEVVDDEVEVIDDVEVVESKPKPKPRMAPVVNKSVRKPVVELDEVEEVDEDEDDLKRRPSKNKKAGKVVKSGAAKVMIRLGILMMILGVVGMVVVKVRDGGNGGVVAGGGNVVQGGGGGKQRGNAREPFVTASNGFSDRMKISDGEPVVTLSNPRREREGEQLVIFVDYECKGVVRLDDGGFRVIPEQGKAFWGDHPFNAGAKGTMKIVIFGFDAGSVATGKVKIDFLLTVDSFNDKYKTASNVVTIQ